MGFYGYFRGITIPANSAPQTKEYYLNSDSRVENEIALVHTRIFGGVSIRYIRDRHIFKIIFISH